MELKDILLNIKGIDERFAALIARYVENYINMSSNKEVVANNLIQQIKKNITEISFQSLDGISGYVSSMESSITLDSNLPEWVIDNTFLHEFTHQVSRNEYVDEDGVRIRLQPNLGMKVGSDESKEFSVGFRLREWEIDGNNYAYNQGIATFDEWVTEWLANKMSGFINVEVKEDENGLFRKKTCHGYDGSNIMNMLELVYGSENIANLITGFDLTEDERKCVIPIKEFHKLNEMIDSNLVLSKEEKEIFENLQPPYMKTPNITGLIVYYISQYRKQDNLENYNVYIQKMLNVLTRTYSIQFNEKIANCGSIDDLNMLYQELTFIQNSMIWSEKQETLNSMESFQLFEKMRSSFISKSNQLGFEESRYNSLNLTPTELLEKFRLEEEEIQKIHGSIKNSSQRM